VTVVAPDPGLPRWLTARRSYEDDLATIPLVIARLRRGGFELIHALHPAAGWAAARAGGPPLVFSLPAAPERRWLVARRYRLELCLAAVAAAAAVTAPDEQASAACRRYLLREARVAASAEDFDALYREVAA
jgi:hypothetical protein